MINIPNAACKTSINEAVCIHRAYASVAWKSPMLPVGALDKARTKTDAHNDVNRIL
jgi:hypothetical protein